MPRPARVAIVILNWNGFDDTVECLTSLQNLDYPDRAIILVDNGSSQKDGLRLKGMFPGIHLIVNGQNRGFAGGNNDGMNWALHNGFDYAVNLNNDAVAEPSWLTRLVAGLQAAGADYGSSQILFYDERGVICSDNDILLPDGSAIPENRGKPYHPSCEPRPLFAACGAGSIYSRKCLEAARLNGDQYFDELHFAYYEDTDLGIRLNTLGFRGVTVPDAILYHKHSRSAGKFSEFKIFQGEKNRILNQVLNFPWPLWFVGESFFIVKLIAGAVSGIVRRGGKGDRYRKNFGVARLLKVLWQARVWIIRHWREIVADRRERKARGLIRWGVWKYFRWDLSGFLR